MSPRQQTLYLSRLPARASADPAPDSDPKPEQGEEEEPERPEVPALTEETLRAWLLGALGKEKEEWLVKVILLRPKNEGFREALVEMSDAEKAQDAHQTLADAKFDGSPISVEFANESNRGASKVILSDVPSSITLSELETLFENFGVVQSCEAHVPRAQKAKTENEGGEGEGDGEAEESSEAAEEVSEPDVRNINVFYQNREDAEKAVKGLNETEVSGVTLSARLVEKKSPKRNPGNAHNNGHGGGGGFHGGPNRQIDFPLRILVQSEMVGAIIGRGGQTIRQITQHTRARVDVHRKDNLGSTEKAITIYGQPDNCTNACKEIMKVMQQEAKNLGKSEEISLKVLAHNNLIGRIIGKQGSTIKKIMEDTNTKITVSSINEINSFNLERIITLSGEIEDIGAAESEISAKLRAAYESDIQAMAPQSVMFPGLHPAAMMQTASLTVVPAQPGQGQGGQFVQHQGQHHHHQQAPHPHQSHGQGMGYRGGNQQGNFNEQFSRGGNQPAGNRVPNVGFDFGGMQQQFGGGNANLQQIQETTFLYVPKNSVGAIIGTKGSHIKNIIKFSGASVKIAQGDGPINANNQTELSESGDQGEQNQQMLLQQPGEDRRVTIIGNPESQWKAQYLIHEKLREESFARGMGGGEDMRLTAEILVPSSQVGRIIGKGGANVRELQRLTGAIIKLPEQGSATAEETPVHITGVFYSTQSAQRRIRAMVMATPSTNNAHHNSVGGAPPVHANNATHALNNGGGRVDGAVETYSEC